METMRMMAGSGRVGAVEIKDFAEQAAKTTATASMFTGARAGNLATLTAIAQEAKLRGGATSATEAMTSAAKFGSDVAKGEAKFAALGIQTKDGKLLRGPEDIIKDSLTKTGGDVSKLSHLFNERSVRGVLGFADIYRQAGGGSGDPKKEKAALEAVTKEFDRLRGAAISEAEQKEAASRRMAEVDMQLRRSMLELNEVTAKELIPPLVAAIPDIAKLVPLFGNLAREGAAFLEFFAKNPLEGFGVALGAAAAVELGKAALAATLERVLSTQLGQVGLIIGTAAIAVQLGKIMIDQEYENEDKARAARRANETAANEIAAKVRNGTATPEEIQRGKQLTGKIAADLDLQDEAAKNPGWAKKVGQGIGSVFAPDATAEAAASEAAAQKQQRDWSAKSLKDLQDALDRNTAATKANTSSGAGHDTGKNNPNRSQPIIHRN